MELVNRDETPLFGLMACLSALGWAALALALPWQAALCLGAMLAAWLVFRSALWAWLQGNAVRIDDLQLSDLKSRIDHCGERLGVPEIPPAYLVQRTSALAELAWRGRAIVLRGDIVDALEAQPGALNFYIGHQIGQIRRRHGRWMPWLLPAAVLPLLGAAYARACQYTCDRHGYHACDTLADAQSGLAALVVGKRWRQLSAQQYAQQAPQGGRFWPAFHELVNGQPWPARRMAALRAWSQGRQEAAARPLLAYAAAALVPRVGGSAGLACLLLVAAVTGVLGASVLPWWRASQTAQHLASAVEVGKNATAAVERFYNAYGRYPDALAQAGFSLDDPARTVVAVRLDSGSGTVRVFPSEYGMRSKAIAFVPQLDAERRLSWSCGSAQIAQPLLPPECRAK